MGKVNGVVNRRRDPIFRPMIFSEPSSGMLA